MPESKQTAPFSCGVPNERTGIVRLGHGSGGKLTSDLIGNTFLGRLGEVFCGQMEDAAVMPPLPGALAVTTDAYVVSPYRFPGGDIGSLAVYGTINDLAVRGARAKYMSASFILEEGLSLTELEYIVDSFKQACLRCGVTLVAADTKVVNKGACDKIFVTTTGIGEVSHTGSPSACAAVPGDVVLVSGNIGMHGMAVMCAREELELEHDLKSDSAPLHTLCDAILSASRSVHALRDITRGGLATVLNELAESSQVGIEIDELTLPVHEQVQAASELLGLDPLYVACEGRLVAIVGADDAERVLAAMKQDLQGTGAAIIGKVVADHPRRLVLKSRIGGKRIVDKLSGDQLPRIC